jgi:hypothetical protein
VPWAVNDRFAYGFVATSSGDVCGRCYEITFSGTGFYDANEAGSRAIQGKRMIVQAINIGYDVSNNQFDLMIPGGGVGRYNACADQWGVSNSELGAQYGGFLSACKDRLGWNASLQQYKDCVAERCRSVFGARGLTQLQRGCQWFVDWFQAADNPRLSFQEVQCPTALTGLSGMRR